MRKVVLALAIVLYLGSAISAEEARLLRFPDVSADRVVFVYAGDLYYAPRAGGQAVQLTTDIGLELFPKFSPNGDQIAFTGQYDGDFSVYVVPLSGGEPKRLTYHPGIQPVAERFGPENLVMGWSHDGTKVLFRSRKETMDLWDGKAYFVNINGGMPEPLPMATAGFTSLSPDGNKVAYCPIARDFRTWKRYKGGMAQNVWIFDLNTFESKKITDWIGTDNMPMWYGDKIYFNSDRTGTLNLYCYEIPTGETRQVTQFTDFDVRWPSLGKDGIAFENGGFVYVLDLPSETMHKVDIELTTDRHLVRAEITSVGDKVADYDISPEGRRAVFRARGDVFSVPAREGITRDLTATPGVNEMVPKWSPDGKWIAYLSDATGEEEFYLKSFDGKETVQLTSNSDCHRYEPSWSPDSKKLVFSDAKARLFSIDIATKKMTQLDKSSFSGFGGVSWSPDSRYVAYSKRLENRIVAVFAYDFKDNTIHQMTPGFTNDYSPAFDPAGKYLYFISERNFNPILGSYEFTFVNNSIDDLYLIVLNSKDKSPFVPKDEQVAAAEEEKKSKDDEEKKSDDKKSKDKKTDEAPAPVVIDFDGIYDRQVAFDLPSGNYGGLSAVKGAVFFVSDGIYGLRGKVTSDLERILCKYDIEKKKKYDFLEKFGGYQISAKGDRMIVNQSGNYFIVPTEGTKAELEDHRVDLSQIEMRVDRRAEYVQMYNQVWRRYRDYFYDANMYGVDWYKMREKYAVLLPYVSHRFDFTYILGELVGELCSSHTYVGGGDLPKVKSSGIGLLGVDFEVDHQDDRIRISRILTGENWDEELRSPLQEPGFGIHEGDYLLAINGHEITAEVNPYSLTQETVGQQITLTVNDKPGMDGSRTVDVKPIRSEEKLRYYNWVLQNRNYVDSASNGRIGYVHIPDMGSWGLVRFTKMFYSQLRKPGLILDVRYNGGGFVSGLILERLRRTVEAMNTSRNYAPGPDPGDGLNAYMLTLQNQFSCSDGDLFPYFFRQYRLGPLMGKRTWGGVIGISGIDGLIDGGYYTVPQWAIYSLDGKWIMENVGVEPDIEVDSPPDREARGFDDQLTEAVSHINKELAEHPKTLPPPPGPPAPR